MTAHGVALAGLWAVIDRPYRGRNYFAAAAVVRLSNLAGAVSFTNKDTTAPKTTPINGIQKIF